MSQTDGQKMNSQAIADKIQSMILDGTLKEGDVLSPERSLAEQFGVGRPTLREAIKALETIGLIESRQGCGNVIVNRVREQSNKPASVAFKLSHGNYAEILELRRAIEYYTVPNAARLAADEDIAELRRLHEQLVHETDLNEISRLDRAFHSAIVSVSKNSLILSTLNNISYLFDAFTEESVRTSLFQGDCLENIYADHAAILAAIAAHDPAAAKQAIVSHLDNIRLWLFAEKTASPAEPPQITL